MKDSNAISAKATESPPPTDLSSDSSRPTPTVVDGFALRGPSALPDPRFAAYRADLADVSLAGAVIASHYAEPLETCVASTARLYAAASDDAEQLGQLDADDGFSLLDDTLGWAWGYGGPGRLVGYIRSAALARD